MAEFLLRFIDLIVNFGALEGIEGDCGTDQAPVDPASDRHHHLQIAQQLGDQGCGRIRGALPLHF